MKHKRSYYWSSSKMNKNARRKKAKNALHFGIGKTRSTLTMAQRKLINVWKRVEKMTQPKKNISSIDVTLGVL